MNEKKVKGKFMKGVCDFVADTKEERNTCETRMKEKKVADEWFNKFSKGYAEWVMGPETKAKEVKEEFR